MPNRSTGVIGIVLSDDAVRSGNKKPRVEGIAAGLGGKT